jgi:hypothetical protein
MPHSRVDSTVPAPVNMQVVNDANTRQGVAVGIPLPGNRHDSRAYAESVSTCGALVLMYWSMAGIWATQR